MYEDVILSYLDILGFRNLVENSTCEEVSAILNQFKYFADDRDQDAPHYRPTILRFSDTVVRVRHLQSRENREIPGSLLFHEILSLLHIQGELIFREILIRGALTVGQISVENNQIFGPSIIEAYNLESRIAVYPRIIISQGAMDAPFTDRRVLSPIHTPEHVLEDIREMVRQDENGIWYIDYLRGFESELDVQELYPDYLGHHRNIILNNRHSEDERIRLKYEWLTNYHNEVVHELNDDVCHELGFDKSELLIVG